jgi:Ca2+-binding EF-hand superfamily protein
MTSVSSSMVSSWTAIEKTLYLSDSNADGVVSASELASVLSSTASAEALLSEADSNGDSALSLSEFTSFADLFSSETGLSLLSSQDIGSAAASLFTSLDSNGDGELSVSELTSASSVLASTSSDTSINASAVLDGTTTASTSSSESLEAKLALASADEDGDGTFTKSDVTSLLLQVTYGIGRHNKAAAFIETAGGLVYTSDDTTVAATDQTDAARKYGAYATTGTSSTFSTTA